jgi:hypothetical protein
MISWTQSPGKGQRLSRQQDNEEIGLSARIRSPQLSV